MKTRFSTVAGYLVTASLLSGSAFAFAPSFGTDLFPSVTITDRIAASGPTLPFDDGTPSGTLSGTQYLFQYEDAIDLSSYVTSLGSGTTINDVKVVFNEFDDDNDLTPNSVHTLSINGQEALNAVPVKADFTGAISAGPLSFRNIDFSPGTGNGPFDAVGASGHDLSVSPQQVRLVNFHIDTLDSNAVDGSPNNIQSKSMNVITELDTAGLGDRTTDPVITDPFNTVLADPGTFNGWSVIFSDNKILFILSGNSETASGNPAVQTAGSSFAGFTFTPTPISAGATGITGDTAPTGSTSLSIASNVAQAGFSGWSNASILALNANTVYRARVELASTGLAAKTNSTILLRFGNAINTGQLVVQFNTAEAYTNPAGGRDIDSLGTSATQLDLYLLTKAAGTASLEASVIDQGITGAASVDVTISGFEIGAASRAALGTGTILKNYGGTAAGAPAGETAWTSAGATPGVTITAGGALNPALPKTLTVTGAALTAQHGPEPSPGDGFAHWDFTRFLFNATNVLNIDTMDTGFSLVPGRLYILDLYASTNNPNANHPFLVTVINMDGSYTNNNLWWVSGGTIGGNPANGLTSTPTVWSTVINPDPNVIPAGNGNARATINIAFLHTNNIDLANTTISIHRMVLTEYDPY